MVVIPHSRMHAHPDGVPDHTFFLVLHFTSDALHLATHDSCDSVKRMQPIAADSYFHTSIFTTVYFINYSSRYMYKHLLLK